MFKLTLLWLLFFITHSVFAVTPVKAFFQNTLKNKFKYYRLFYNALSLFLILWIVCILLRMPSTYLVETDVFLNSVGLITMLLGFGVMALAFNQLDMLSFLGFSQKPESTSLNTEGVYRIVRHPLYFGIFLFLMGVFFIVPTHSILLSVAMGIIYIAVGIEFEEKKLRREFGEVYLDFTHNKKKFIPFIY